MKTYSDSEENAIKIKQNIKVRGCVQNGSTTFTTQICRT